MVERTVHQQVQENIQQTELRRAMAAGLAPSGRNPVRFLFADGNTQSGVGVSIEV
jgi:hypothetical protein